jgi:hypothetical protein
MAELMRENWRLKQALKFELGRRESQKDESVSKMFEALSSTQDSALDKLIDAAVEFEATWAGDMPEAGFDLMQAVREFKG